jgi:hypothetical protein
MIAIPIAVLQNLTSVIELSDKTYGWSIQMPTGE